MRPLYNKKPAIYGISINSFVFDETRIDEMPPERVRKIRSYRFLDDRRRSFAAELLLEAALGKDAAFSVSQDDMGKPYIEGGPHFSISHSGDWTVLAVCGEPLGLDIEACSRPRDTDGIARRVFHPAERAEALRDVKMFYRVWTAKESYIKMLGKGLAELSRFRVIFANGVGRVEGDPHTVIHTFDHIDGYAAAVCSPAGIDWPRRILTLT
jgi:4'-phosphopantetheinyl transferase